MQQGISTSLGESPALRKLWEGDFLGDSSTFSSLTENALSLTARKTILAYKHAIKKNIRPTDVVLDLDCGIGSLSFFAAISGCQKVYGVDSSDLIETACEIAKKNHLEHRIEFVKSDIFHLKLKEKVDVILHNKGGILLTEQHVVDKLKFARKAFLKPGGRIIPPVLKWYLVPVYFESPLEKLLTFWRKKQYGIDFSVMNHKLILENIHWVNSPIKLDAFTKLKLACPKKLAFKLSLNEYSKIPSPIEVGFKLRSSFSPNGICSFIGAEFNKDDEFFPLTEKIVFFPIFQQIQPKKTLTLKVLMFPGQTPVKWRVIAC